ncbi:MAG: SusC/RagA family TonB-linked outer membrane protein [Flavobacterium sp. MedPE-SWcel]|uniref:SusC/RagA family TonB-linked outer membrane protein n=1 Tax=uncultured Flavobacterium sp. TaxID=165435 RepID=UPI000914B1CD|nr:TonB-dependent receptor [uncultured Flavobacterium sp.]OIQ17627.1 MAG: SusC/RagA family TonB-linked outer membrane protein [Flavobacterium sp. MedPE-SWcel]
MKTMYKKFLLLLLMLPLSVLAQSTLTGVVSDTTTGQPIPSVNIIIEGTNRGTTTDIDGNYTLTDVKAGDQIVFSFIGFANQTIEYTGQSTLDVVLLEDATQLEEVVVIGYGTARKKDATGSVTTVNAKDFNKGAITTADQLLTGKAPGVRITSTGGQPDAAPNIRIRGGSSLSAQNNPLIVIDGIPLDFVNPAGVSNPLSLVNPSDIESFTVLKDASATAIYGSRASNGVIIITTKKGTSGVPQFNYNANISFGKATDLINVMDGTTFTRFIQEYHPDFTRYLGIDDPTTDAVDNPATEEVEGRILYNTKWQDEILRTSIFTNHNFSARANLFGKVPSRLSIGYTKNEGVVKTNDYERYSASVKITPSFIDDHLKVDVNAKGFWVDKNTVDEGGALGGAFNMDPTKPVYTTADTNNFGGYYQNTTADDPRDFDGQYNPVNLLNERRRPEQVNKLLGNVKFDYKMHFLPDLRAVVNLGIEASRAKITERYGEYAFASYQVDNENDSWVFNPGVNFRETQNITNKTMDAYLAYNKSLTGPITRIDAQVGHAFQSFVNDGYKTEYQYSTLTGLREEKINEENPNNRYYNKTVLESYFGRANVDLYDKYLFTFTLRADGSSLFREDDRWGYFPAAAVAWRVTDEDFLRDVKFINNLKLRVGYGQTGQQDITGVAGYYPSSPIFSAGDANSQYLPGVSTYSANPFNDQLKWEITTTYNVGVDFSFFKRELLSGSIDVYRRVTDDLLVKSAVPPGQYLTNAITQNVGSLENKGIEIDLRLRPITTDNFSWDLSGNLSYNFGEVTDLKNVTSISANESTLPTGTGVNLARHSVGSQPYSAWVFEQLYDNEGRPIVDSYRDRNGDGVISNDDRYYKALRPNWTFGFATNFNYKNFDLSASFHGQLDGQVYNAIKLAGGWTDRPLPNNTNSLSNVLDFYDGAADPRFQTINGNIPLSDYYLESAAFLRCDNITLGYRFNNIFKSASLRVYGGVNNAFIITKYSGQDPENFNAIDSNIYPRPRLYNFGVNLDF